MEPVGTARDSGPDPLTLPSPGDLPALASAQPADALAAARAWIVRTRVPAELARAHQAAGIVLRDRGDHAAGRDHLRRGLAAARRSHDRALLADVRATYGATLALTGQRRRGLDHLALALEEVDRPGRAAVLMRRAFVLAETGDHAAALVDLRHGLVLARRNDDRLWEARMLHLRCHVQLGLGRATRARADAETAAAIFDSLGQTLMSVQTRHNRAHAAVLQGDLVTALQEYDEVAARYRELGVGDEPLLVVDHLAALLAAGLVDEAASVADAALRRTEQGDQGQSVHRGPLLVAAATAELERGRPETARAHAESAVRVFRAAHRQAWTGRAALLAVRARFLAGDQGTAVQRAASTLAHDPSLFVEDQTAAAMLLARIAVARGDHDVARDALGDISSRSRGPALTRATAWLARALLAELDEDGAAVRRACARGLDAIDAHRSVFGAVELSAAASVHGAEFAGLAGRRLIQESGPRALLAWVERFRSTSLADPRPDAARDDELGRRLARARSAAAVARGGEDTAVADAEREVRALRVATSGTAPTRGVAGRHVVPGDLGDRTLLELFVHDGEVHTLVVRRGRVRRRTHVASLTEVRREIEFLRFALRRGASGVGGTSIARLERAARRVEQAIFGPGGLARTLSSPGEDGAEVVVVPPAALHDVPWSALPALAERTVVVSPSAAFWQRAFVGRAERRAGEVLALGPGLTAGEDEVAALAALHPTAEVLGTSGATALVEDVLSAMDGARLAHLTAHGTLRADSPMFSAIHLEDGPLFVHDLERLSRAPREVLLAACHSGLGADVGADQLLGLASGLLRAGTSAVLTSVVAVNDVATASYTVAVHRSLARGVSLPVAAGSALDEARGTGDPALLATAMSFGVWGA